MTSASAFEIFGSPGRIKVALGGLECFDGLHVLLVCGRGFHRNVEVEDLFRKCADVFCCRQSRIVEMRHGRSLYLASVREIASNRVRAARARWEFRAFQPLPSSASSGRPVNSSQG